MQFTDIFIKRPVLATVVSLMILAMGLRSMGSLAVRQYPFTENAVVTVTTTYTGASPEVVAGFITTPLEYSISQADGIDYLTSTSTQSTSTIEAHLKLNYDANKALSEINTKVNAVLNQLPKNSQLPVITVAIGETLDAMYIGFYSNVLPDNKFSDYLVRVVYPRFQSVQGVQHAEILGSRQIAMRAWLDPVKLAGFGISPADIATALANNDFISAAGRTDGTMVTMNLSADTGLTDVGQFSRMVLKAQNGAIIRLGDVARVSLGATNYDTTVSFDGRTAVYIGIAIVPSANLLTVIKDVKKAFTELQRQMPVGVYGKIVYDATDFVESSIREVIRSLSEALIIVTVVIFLFLGTIRTVFIPVVAIPLSLIGSFFIMLVLGYSINLLTLLALVLAIGLVVDDAIIVVENVQRHIEEGKPPFEAALQGASELAGPIVAISVVLVAVYVPIGFMGGLTGALFTEFAFTLASAVGVSAIVALTLSPMMCSKLLKPIHHTDQQWHFIDFVDRQFDKLRHAYHHRLQRSLDYLPVTGVFAGIVLVSIYFLFITSTSELAPQEDLGIIIAQLTGPPNAALAQTQRYSNEVYRIFKHIAETQNVFQIVGASGLNSSITGLGLKPWDERTRTSNQIQPQLQAQLDNIAGAKVAAFQPPSLPGSSGLPIQFVITTTENFDRLNEVNQALMNKALASGLFIYLDTDLKIDKVQANLLLDRDKIAELGLTMQDVSNSLASVLSQGYINYFNYVGRSYQVIPQVIHRDRLNAQQVLDYYVTSAAGTAVPLSTFTKIKNIIVPESLNHFQQLNSATLSAVAFPGVTTGQALSALQGFANEVLPQGYAIDYAGQSRQFVQESAALMATFFFAMVVIFLSLAALFESFRDPLIVLVSVPMSICGALIFISLGVGGASLNIYTEVGLVTLIGLISKHGILIVQFANDLQKEGKSKREAIQSAASIRLRPILMTTAAMVLGVVPLINATGAGAVSRFNIGLVIASGISIGTVFTLFVVPAMYLFLAQDHAKRSPVAAASAIVPEGP